MPDIPPRLNLGAGAPNFNLPDTSGHYWSLDSIGPTKGVLVTFICNLCPFVLHILDEFIGFAREYDAKGIKVIAICSNDVVTHPEDSPAAMAKLARDRGFPFPYLYDEDQRTAMAYGAACTPDFYLFNETRQLYYDGRFDDSRPIVPKLNMNVAMVVTGKELRAAADAMLAGRPAPQPIASIGCSIKWKPEPV
jgi:peroxiredoxin